MDDLGFLTQWVDPRVAATAVALTEWLKASMLPERLKKGRAIRLVALLVVALCYVALWAAESFEEVRRIGLRVAAIVATYVLSKVGYEAVKGVGVPEDRQAEVTIEAGEEAMVTVDEPQPQTTLDARETPLEDRPTLTRPTPQEPQFGTYDVTKGT